MTPTRHASLPYFLTAAVAAATSAACVEADPIDDELADDAGDLDGLDEGKDDGPGGVSTYFQIWATAGGGGVVQRLGRSTTRCVDSLDRPEQARCMADQFDWEATGWDEGMVTEWENRLPPIEDEGAVTRGTQPFIARGRLRSVVVDLGGEAGRVSVFEVTELWAGLSDWLGDGPAVKITDRPGTCTAPCEGLLERRVNGTTRATIEAVDLADAGVIPATAEFALGELSGDGLIVTGTRTRRSERGVALRGRAASSVFTRVRPGS